MNCKYLESLFINKQFLLKNFCQLSIFLISFLFFSKSYLDSQLNGFFEKVSEKYLVFVLTQIVFLFIFTT